MSVEIRDNNKNSYLKLRMKKKLEKRTEKTMLRDQGPVEKWRLSDRQDSCWDSLGYPLKYSCDSQKNPCFKKKDPKERIQETVVKIKQIIGLL